MAALETILMGMVVTVTQKAVVLVTMPTVAGHTFGTAMVVKSMVMLVLIASVAMRIAMKRIDSDNDGDDN